MHRTRILQKLRRNSRRRFVATLITLAALSPATAEVIDLPAETLTPNRAVFTDQAPSSAQGRRHSIVQVGLVQQDQAAQSDQIQAPQQQQAPQQGRTPDSARAADAAEAQAPASPSDLQVPPELNVDPDADIDDLTAPQPQPQPAPQPVQPPPAPPGSSGRLGLGATAAGFSAAPTMIGDLFGGSFSTFSGAQTVNFSSHAAGRILAGNPGSPTSTIAFEFGGEQVPDDVFTSGTGSDNSNPLDGNADTFSIAEPLPPNDALTSPGPGFLFDGGTAVFTGNTEDSSAQPGIYTDGEQWFISYSYTQVLESGEEVGGRPIPGPGTAVRRVKLAENFSPEVRDRCYLTYNFFNDAYGGLGDVSRYVLGMERILVDRLVSFEIRLPMAGTYGSRQDLTQPEDRDYEFGNSALISKFVLLRSESILWSSGVGVTLPTADDSRIYSGNREVLRVENETVHILPYSALLLRPNRETSLQAYLQLDVAANGDPVYGDLTGNSLPQLGVFNDSTLLNIDVAISHSLFRSRNRSALQQVIGNAELHYTGTLQESDFVQRSGIRYRNLKRNFNVVNATGGLHFVLNNNWVVTPGISVPLRDGLDEQFDYEALVQVNWLR